MKILVTGCAGFIGSHVVERYLAEGHQVWGLDNLSRPGSTKNLEILQALDHDGRFHFFPADIRIAGDIDRAIQAAGRLDAVIHEAGQVAVTTSVTEPRHDFEVNALGTFNVLDSVRRLSPEAAFLFASTNKVYGKLEHRQAVQAGKRYAYRDCPGGIPEDEPLDFHSPYGCSKGAAEQYVRDHHRIYGMRTVVFRQSCIYGTRQFGIEDQGWISWFTIAAMLRRPITVYGDGMQVRDVLWVGDLMDLYARALDRIDVAAGEIYNAGGGPQCTLSLLELLDSLERRLGRHIEHSFADWRPGDQRIFVADCAKAARELDWRPQVAPAEGLDRLAGWTEQNLELIAGLVASRPKL
jgi:CDP-paratose 2-epimerase